MWPSLANTLSWWQWTILAIVPPAIVALYFLKLKRKPVEVPSTYLWLKSIEDLHVNSIWQRLRRNLLLLLQLLLLLLVAIALLRPSWRGSTLQGDRFIVMVDASASMQATDVAGTRLNDAKRRANEMVDRMKSGDVAMVISFTDTAKVEQPFTDNRRLLHRAIEAIAPTQRPTALGEALKVASGLAQPGGSPQSTDDPQATGPHSAESLPADLYIFSDGRFPPVADFSLGYLKPIFQPIGDPEAANVGIVAFSVGRNEARTYESQAYARLENFGRQDVEVEVELRLDGRLINADTVSIAAGQHAGVKFDLGELDEGVLHLAASTSDNLRVDDEAYAVVTPPRPASVLLVTPGNEPLEFALKSDAAQKYANVEVKGPDYLATDQYARATAGRAFDLVIYDRCRPKSMPPANTLFIGQLPPGKDWAANGQVAMPQVIDIEAAHPLMQWIDLGDVILEETTPLVVPRAGTTLIDSDAGPVLAIAPRESFEDAVLGFRIVYQDKDEQGNSGVFVGSNWHKRASFPVFVLNLLDYLGGSRDAVRTGSVRPGQPIDIEAPAPGGKISVKSPSGDITKDKADASAKLDFTNTDELGVYEVEADGKLLRRFAVNLFDPTESNIPPQAEPVIKIGHVEVTGQSHRDVARQETWRWILLAGLAILLLEWYIYNRRVSL